MTAEQKTPPAAPQAGRNASVKAARQPTGKGCAGSDTKGGITQ